MLQTKFPLAISLNFQMAPIEKITPTVHFMEMFANCQIFLLSGRLKKVSGCAAYIICIAQITYKMIHNALLIDNGLILIFEW